MELKYNKEAAEKLRTDIRKSIKKLNSTGEALKAMKENLEWNDSKKNAYVEVLVKSLHIVGDSMEKLIVLEKQVDGAIKIWRG